MNELIYSPKMLEERDFQRAKEVAADDLAGHDSASDRLYFSVPGVEFRDFPQLVTGTLEKSGFEPNLENILGALETLRVSRLVLDQRSGGRVRRFSRVVSFRLPKKGQAGVLLGSLYALLDSLSLDGLKDQDRRKRVHADAQEEKGDQRELRKLQEENLSLRSQIARLRDQVSAMGEKQALNGLQRGLAELKAESQTLKKLEGYQLEILETSQIRQTSGVVELRKGRRRYDYPLSRLSHFPREGAWGVALLEGGTIVRLMPFGPGWEPFSLAPAVVLASSRKSVKVRIQGSGVGTCHSDSKYRRGQIVIAQLAQKNLISVLPRWDASQRSVLLSLEALDSSIRLAETQQDPQRGSEEASGELL